MGDCILKVLKTRVHVTLISSYQQVHNRCLLYWHGNLKWIGSGVPFTKYIVQPRLLYCFTALLLTMTSYSHNDSIDRDHYHSLSLSLELMTIDSKNQDDDIVT